MAAALNPLPLTNNPITVKLESLNLAVTLPAELLVGDASNLAETRKP